MVVPGCTTAPATMATAAAGTPGGVDTGCVRGRTTALIAGAGAATPPGRSTGPDDMAVAIHAPAVHLRQSTGTRIVVDAGRSPMSPT